MLKRASGDIFATYSVMPVPIKSSTDVPQIAFSIGIMKNHTRNDPQQIMKAYFSPMIKPSPSTAAPT